MTIKTRVDLALRGVDPHTIDYVVIPLDEWDAFCTAIGRRHPTAVTYKGLTCKLMTISTDVLIRLKGLPPRAQQSQAST